MRDGRMTERDWAEIEGQLLQAYKLLKGRHRRTLTTGAMKKAPARCRGFQDFKFGRDQYLAATGGAPQKLKR